ncbi:hypothetical protein GCM10025789_27390 [Tessaracoccus lubricantis]|uniref:CDP-alcohol phosphatidyltransferase n=1 Tax=Tessaracoccus lubricantis TaxID=545543 RepID=A0ABP9FLL2_9ACTN
MRTLSALRLTPGDRVTVMRAGMGVVCGLLVVGTLLGALPERNWPLFLLAVPTVLLDAVDGAVARATGTVTERGARWDIAVDAAVLLTLSVALVPIAPWVLVMGTARYLFLLVGRVRPVWLGELPFRQSRRLIGAFQAVVTVLALAPVVPVWLAQWATALAVALVVYSFARDIQFLERSAS